MKGRTNAATTSATSPPTSAHLLQSHVSPKAIASPPHVTQLLELATKSQKHVILKMPVTGTVVTLQTVFVSLPLRVMQRICVLRLFVHPMEG